MKPLDRAIFVGMFIVVLAIVLAGAIKQESPPVYQLPDIIILAIQPQPTLYGATTWYIDYLIGVEPHMVSVPTEEHARRFVDYLSSVGHVTYLSEAKQ